MATTWNPSDKGAGVTLSGGNLGMSVLASGTDSVRATANKSSGKWYFEFTVTSGSGAGFNLGIGVANASAAITSTFLGGDANAMVYRGGDGAVKQNATTRATFATFGTGDVIGVAFDATSRTVSFYKNNALQGTLSTNVPTGALYPVAGGEGGGSASAGTANFGATTTTYTPPTGYSTIDTAGVDIGTSGALYVGGAATFYPPSDIASSASLLVGGAADFQSKAAFVVTSTAQAYVGGAATWEIPTTSLTETLPPYSSTGSVVGGTLITASATLAPHDASAAVLVGAVLNADVGLPAFTMLGDFGWFADNAIAAHALDASVLVGTVSSGALTLPVYTLSAASLGGEGQMAGDNALPVFVIQASVNAGSYSTAALLIPAHQLIAAGFSGAVLTADADLPAYALVSVGFGNYILSGDNALPAYRLDAAMSAAVVAAFRAWVLNLHNRALTEYTNFTFNSFAVCDGRLFGAGPYGIVELTEATTDNGADINAIVRTGKHSFGASYGKRVPRIYTAVATAGDLEFRTITGADGRRGYLLPWNQTTELQQRRVPIGRGPKSVYWQFELVNRNGADFQLEAIMPKPELTPRRVAPS